MRFFLALGLLITLCASAGAATCGTLDMSSSILGTSTPFRAGPTLRLGRSTTTTHRATTIHPSLAVAINPYWPGQPRASSSGAEDLCSRSAQAVTARRRDGGPVDRRAGRSPGRPAGSLARTAAVRRSAASPGATLTPGLDHRMTR